MRTINYKRKIYSVFKKKSVSFFIGIVTFFFFLLFFANYLVKFNVFPFRSTPTKAIEKYSTKADEKKYIVKEGDDIWKISETVCGTGDTAFDIAAINNIANPDLIDVGQILTIPERCQSLHREGDISSLSTGQVTQFGSSYKVQEGDYLWKIAEKTYGDGNMMQRIIIENNLTNPNDLKTGIILKIPRQ